MSKLISKFAHHGSRRALCFSVVLTLFFLPQDSAAQDRPPSPLFSLMHLRLVPANPAARPASMGGAFIGVADDATAAAINPAGLAYLSSPEISLSHAVGKQTRSYPVGGGGFGIESHNDRNPIFNQTLVNIAYPYRGVTFALYRQLAFRSEFDFAREQFIVSAPSRPLTVEEQFGFNGNFPGILSDFQSEVIHNAIVVATSVRRRWRFGATLSATQFRIRLHERRYFDPQLWLRSEFDPRSVPLGESRVEGLYAIYYLEQNKFAPSWNFGMLVELDPSLNIGIVYQHLPSFRIVNRVTYPAYTLPSRSEGGAPTHFEAQEETMPFRLNLPDNLGLGLSWKPSGVFLLGMDALWHWNETLLQGLAMNWPYDDVANGEGVYRDPDGADDLRAKDLFTFRGGLEYRVIKPRFILPFRLGVYTEPNFALQAQTSNLVLLNEYPRDSAQLHVTGGVGFIYKNLRLEGSWDISSSLMESIGSAVVSF